MHLRFIYLMCLFAIPLVSIAKERLIIAFAPGDCPNCNVILPYISNDTNLLMNFVIKQRYAKDEKIIKEKYLKNIRVDSIIYSDELYHKYADDRGTTISNVSMSYSKAVRNISIRDIDFIEKFISLSSKLGNNQLYSSEYFEHSYQFSEDGDLYYFNKLYGTINKLNLLDGKDSIVFQLDSITISKVYEKAFNTKNAFSDQISKIGHLVPIGLVSIKSFAVKDSKVYVGLSFYFETADTNIASAQAIVAIGPSGNSISILNSINDINAFYTNKSHVPKVGMIGTVIMQSHHNGLILSYNKYIPDDRTFLCLWMNETVNPIVQTLPQLYGRGHMNIPLIAGDKYMLPLESKIFDLNSSKVIDLNIFESPDIVISENDPSFMQKIIYVIVDFKEDDKYFYIVYRKRETPNISILHKIDKQTLNKQEFTFSTNTNMPVLMNPYNYNTVLVPNGEQMDIVKYN